jgi:ABC-type multidrug transport system fused ATPase/permease subunit
MDDVFDKILFEIVMKNFANSTVLTILNKLEMVHHFDKCVVLEDGKCMEIGMPSNIIIRKNSYLVRMLLDRGGGSM